MSTKIIERKRNGLNVVHCFFYSGLACLVPYLSTHMREIGITKLESAWITSIVSLVSMIGPLCLGPIAYKFNKYKSLLVICLTFAAISYTGLLFVPKVIRYERQPKIYLDCTDSVLLVEQCPNWEGQCHTYPKRFSESFSNFELSNCAHVCQHINKMNDSLKQFADKYQVCFRGQNDDNRDESSHLCLPHEERDDTTAQITPRIQFDARFDRWPSVDSPINDNIRRVIDSRTCAYMPAPPLLVNQKLYYQIQCRPVLRYCNIFCKINLRHRQKSSENGGEMFRSPPSCLIEIGDPAQTFYSYLIIRSVADLSLFTAYTLLDALLVALTNDFDSIYGGYSKLWAFIIPMIAFPPISGQLVDYFSQPESPNYAPPIILFDGLIIITAFLVIMMPLSPITMISKSISQSIGRNSPVVPTKQLYPRKHSKKSAFFKLIFVFPLILILGTEWGLLETFLHPFYSDIGLSKFLIGLTFTTTFLTAAPFTVIAKPLINGIGRVHLIILAFIFYALRFGGLSFLLKPKWLYIPLEMMESFSLPIGWIGITSFCHDLIKRSPSASTYATGTIYQKYSHHIVLQYTLNLLHFAGGRALGAVIGGVWLLWWPESDHLWYWLSDAQFDADQHYSHEDEDGFRVFLRLFAIQSACIGIIFAFLYHCCCNCQSKKSSKKSTQQENRSPVVLNGNYSRLMESQSQSPPEKFQLKESDLKSNVNKKRSNGESKIKMADEDVEDEETLLTRK